MAFKLTKNDVTTTPAAEYMPCSMGEYSPGDAIAFSEGKLTKASADTLPTYVCLEKGTKKENETLCVYRILPSMTFETVSSENKTSFEIGEKYALNASADGITSTKGSSFEVTSLTSKGASTVIKGRFN